MRYILSRIMLAEAAFMVIPLAVTLIYREWNDILSFVIPIAALAAAGLLISIKAPRDGALFARDGLAIVALSWIIMSAFGALPLLISRAVPTYIDAFFETVSGFTTTGASVIDPAKLADVATGTPAAIGCGVLFWRSFTHWIGGMGVLVFVMAILPISGSRGMHIMRAEVPGPEVGKLVTKMSKTAKILYGIYLGLTLLEVIFLICGGMTPYDALIHAFGTAGTGGFSNQAASVGAYNSVYIDVVVSVFMLIFGVNFNIYYFILIKQVKKAVRNLELRVYLVIVAVSTGVVAANIIHIYRNFGTSLRYAFFHVSSLITTTGFSTGGNAVNFNNWPTLSKCVIVLLMFLGAMAGSTGGGIKTQRIIILVKAGIAELKKLLHPRSVHPVKIDGKPVEDTTIRGTLVYFVLYSVIVVFSCLLLSLDPAAQNNGTTTFTAVMSCLNNIGPGLGGISPPDGNFMFFSQPAKLLLSFDMLLGRLEIYPILMIFAPGMWIRRRRLGRSSRDVETIPPSADAEE